MKKWQKADAETAVRAKHRWILCTAYIPPLSITAADAVT